jgi:hypothetical protein
MPAHNTMASGAIVH